MLQVSDTIFTWSDLQAKNNGELLANLGNFINRGLKFVADRLGSTIPEAKGAASNEAIIALGKEVQENVKEYVGKLEKVSGY
jgi:methionyl-tRNA synthetase